MGEEGEEKSRQIYSMVTGSNKWDGETHSTSLFANGHLLFEGCNALV